MINLNKHSTTALGYFLIVAILGVVLRLFFVMPLPFNFKYILHAHSHTALLGWIYIGLTTLIYKVYLQNPSASKKYRKLFIWTNIAVLGMLFTFPFQGYGLFSILFSTLFLFVSYYFYWFSMKYVSLEHKNTFSWKIIKSALFYLVFSSIGPYMIAVVQATLGAESIWYKNSIYFYLHFQYNGWIIVALLGLLFFVLEQNKFQFNANNQRTIFQCVHLSVILTFFLSVLWSTPNVTFNILGGIGAVLQLYLFYKIFSIIKKPFSDWRRKFTKGNQILIHVAVAILVIKSLLQLLSAVPYIASLAVHFKDFVIGYLHLVLLGVVTNFMFVLLHHFKLLQFPKYFISIYLFAFFSTEILIFYKALSLWLQLPFSQNYYLILVGFTCLYPISISLLFYKSLKNFQILKS